MPFEIIREDITKIQVDAVVNAANSGLRQGGGVCGAIFEAAGAEELQEACNRWKGCEVGDAVITPGFNLKAKFIIHAVGPIWSGGKSQEPELLEKAYLKSMELAVAHGCESMAFPLISSGIYGYPKDLALKVATQTILSFLSDHDLKVYLAVFDEKAFSQSTKLFQNIRQFVDAHYVSEKEKKFAYRRSKLLIEESCEEQDFLLDALPKSSKAKEPAYVYSQKSLKNIMDALEENFAQRLFRLIDERGMTDAMTYKKANIDRRLFSKLKNDPQYNPSKITAIAYALALELGLDETKDLIAKAGYTLTRSSKFDLIVEYFINEGNYDVYALNEALFAFEQPLIGA